MPGQPPRSIRFDTRTLTKADGTTRTITRARCYVADGVGKRREVAASGPSRPAAKRELLAALGRAPELAGVTSGRTRLRVFAEIMFAEKTAAQAAGNLSPGTLRNYQAHWRRWVEPAMGDMAIEWVGVQCCDRFLKSLRESKGYATVKGVRSVLAEILAVAVRYEAIPQPNPIEGCADIPGDGSRRIKALEAGEAVQIWYKLQVLASTPGPVVNHRSYRSTMCDPMLPDLWLWMLGTGDRISAALAARWLLIDMTTGTARLGPNVIRVPGVGLKISEGTSKSREVAGVDLPEQVIVMLLARRELPNFDPSGLVFPAVFGGPLDPSNVSSKKLRPALMRIGYGHVSSHWCRRTLGSELNAAGMSLMEIAGRLRHADSRTTERHYVDKRGGNPRVKAAIEAMLSAEPQRRVGTLD